MRGVLAACLVALAATGCSESNASENTPLSAISPDLPPAPNTWPKYPKFSSHSCWARPTTSTSIMQVAPSFPVERASPVPPRKIVRRFLARFGDRSLIRGIEIGKPPPHRLLRHVFPGKRPPKDAVWAYFNAPSASIDPDGHPAPGQAQAATLARWQIALAGGALRDDFCSAGGRTLAGWSISRTVIDGGVSDETFALKQRFPNPSPAEFRVRAALAGKKFGFRVESIRFLRPRELAPIVLVRTARDRKEFIRDVPAILDVLDPKSVSRHRYAMTFEGIFFEASDSKGAFVRVNDAYRGEIMGGQWSAERDAYPYPHG